MLGQLGKVGVAEVLAAGQVVLGEGDFLGEFGAGFFAVDAEDSVKDVANFWWKSAS